MSKLYQGKYRDLDFNTNTLQDDNQDSISVGSFYPLSKGKCKTLLENEKARTTDKMVDQPVQHRVGIITKGEKNYNISSQFQVLQILTNILCLLLQTSGVKIKDGHIDPTNMGSLAMLTIEIIKMLNKSSIKKWFNGMKNDYPFLAINIIDTYNQGWINWIKACLQLAYSENIFHTQEAPDELKYAFKILSDIPKSIMEASKKNNIGTWTNPCTLYLNMQKEKETVESKKTKEQRE